MKNLFVFILVFYSLQTTAQQYQYVQMPTADASWKWHFSASSGIYNHFSTDYLLLLDGSDTVLQGKTYKKIFKRISSTTNPAIANAPDIFVGGIREDSKIVYAVGFLGYLNYSFCDTCPEYVSYNFNMQQVGDTCYSPSVCNLCIVEAIDTISINNMLRKRFKLKMAAPNDVYLIEGIGSTFQWESGQMAWSNLYCYSHNGHAQYGQDCSYIYAYGTPASIINASEHNVKIYPNPFNEYAIVEGDNIASLLIYNSLGSLIAQRNINETKTVIATTNFAAGMYFMVLRDKNNTVIQTQKLLKN